MKRRLIILALLLLMPLASTACKKTALGPVDLSDQFCMGCGV